MPHRATGAPVPLSSIATVSERPMALAVNHGAVPGGHHFVQPAPACRWACGAGGQPSAQLRDEGMPLSVDTQFQGAALAFQASLSNTLC
jgi:multidrug efflux pump